MKNSKVLWIVIGTVIAALAAYGAYVLIKKNAKKKALSKSEADEECDEIFTDEDIDFLK